MFTIESGNSASGSFTTSAYISYGLNYTSCSINVCVHL